ncbi:MAG: hypothetical protein LBQ12_03355 [Deltaproteobacteria bacterium]|nr:hypothetical protein [Deltaproteobacteria bacterium]
MVWVPARLARAFRAESLSEGSEWSGGGASPSPEAGRSHGSRPRGYRAKASSAGGAALPVPSKPSNAPAATEAAALRQNSLLQVVKAAGSSAW